MQTPDKPLARIAPDSRLAPTEIQRAVRDLRSSRNANAKRPGFKRLTDKEIRAAIREGRP